MIWLLAALACSGAKAPAVDSAPADSGDSGGLRWFADCDGDGYGDPWSDQRGDDAPAGYVANSDDCDDTRADVYPEAEEACDGVDHDCDGLTDQADSSDAAEWWQDADGDGFGDALATSVACDAPSGAVAPGEADCDDLDPAVRPGAIDACGDGLDADCDGVDTSDGATWWADADLDGYGDDGNPLVACDPGVGWTAPGEADCDDSDDSIHPGADDPCMDGIDADCDGDAADTCGRDRPLDLARWTLYGDTADERLGGTVLLAGDGSGDAVVTGQCRGLVVAGGSAGDLAPGDAVGSVADLCQASLYTDMDGDGVADLVGWVSGDSGEGLMGWSGPLRGAVTSADAAWTFDAGLQSAVSATDADGDGLVDLWVAYSADAEAPVLLLPGPTPTAIDAALAEIGEPNIYGGWAYDLVGDRDVDGDGVADLVHHELDRGYWSTGTVHLSVYLGPHSGTRTRSEAASTVALGDFSGEGGLSVGDLTGDGLDDLAFAVATGTGTTDSAGTTYVFAGPVTGVFALADAVATFEGESNNDKAGAAVVADADVDGDGRVDLLLGSPGAPEGWHFGGVQVVLGPVGAGAFSLADSDQRWLGDSWQEAGVSLDAGDVDGDGAAELLVGATSWDPSTARGAAWLLPGGL